MQVHQAFSFVLYDSIIIRGYSSSAQYFIFQLGMLVICLYVTFRGGHQDAITGVDAYLRESCITSGGRDLSVIVYVLAEDKQLRFDGHQDSIDGVKLVNEKAFVTFGQDGWVYVPVLPVFNLCSQSSMSASLFPYYSLQKQLIMRLFSPSPKPPEGSKEKIFGKMFSKV